MIAEDLVVGKHYTNKACPGSTVQYVGICKGLYAGAHDFDGVYISPGLICNDEELSLLIREITEENDHA